MIITIKIVIIITIIPIVYTILLVILTVSVVIVDAKALPLCAAPGGTDPLRTEGLV
jgi:hypothetical protein